jgi:hypothetical protein
MLRRLARPIKIEPMLVVGVVPMARYKTVDTQPRFLPVYLARQLQPGTFEHPRSHLLDHGLDAAVPGSLARHRAEDQRATGPHADVIIVSGLPGRVPDP